jgi:hypothetical protein
MRCAMAWLEIAGGQVTFGGRLPALE